MAAPAAEQGGEGEEVFLCKGFEDLGLKDDLLRGVFAFGLEKPSPVQERAMGPIIGGRDTIVQAQSGMGKTMAYLIAALQRVQLSRKACQALVLVPTRELALSIHTTAGKLAMYMQGLRCFVLTGGSMRREDAQRLKEGQHVVIGCPGRVIDTIDRKDFKVRHLELLVLDEADQMLSGDFKDSVSRVCDALPKETQQTCQVCLVSATLPQSVLSLADRILVNPVRILTEDMALEGIQQFHVKVSDRSCKLGVLSDLYNTLNFAQSIVYFNKKEHLEEAACYLTELSFAVSVMHAELDAQTRRTVMENFRAGASRVLLATDVLSRGIDVQQVSTVVNFDMPNQVDTYVHRIGRSGRFGRKGMAISLVTPREARQLKAVEGYLRTGIPDLPGSVVRP